MQPQLENKPRFFLQSFLSFHALLLAYAWCMGLGDSSLVSVMATANFASKQTILTWT